jgi:hypothetical protein
MALLPPFMLDAVVAIGIGDNLESRRWIGTGFLFGESLGGSSPHWMPYLVTNKHVLGLNEKVWVKFNSASGLDSADYPLLLKDATGKQLWTGHPVTDTDVAVVSIHGDYLQKEARRFSIFRSDSHLMTRKEMSEGQITEGDRIFVLGFPMGLVDQVRQYTICRHGILSRIRDCLDGRSSSFLVDAAVFPGNSGGPVIICPSALAIEGTRTIPRAALIGIVKAYLFYEDVAVSRHTGTARVSFQENSGLARVESIDCVLETIAEDKKAKIAQATNA